MALIVCGPTGAPNLSVTLQLETPLTLFPCARLHVLKVSEVAVSLNAMVPPGLVVEAVKMTSFTWTVSVKLAPTTPIVLSDEIVVAVGTAPVAALTTTEFDVPVMAGLRVSDAVIVWLGVVFNVAEKVPVPWLSVESAGKTGCPSVLEKCTVPV